MPQLSARRFYEQCFRHLRAEVGAKRLSAHLRPLRHGDIADALPPFEEPAYDGLRRFMGRYGFLDASDPPARQRAELEQFVRNLSRESGVGNAEAAAVLRLHADGDSTLSLEAICGDVPACGRCALSEQCRLALARDPATYSEEERPLRRLEVDGPGVLATAELLALLLPDKPPRRRRKWTDAARVDFARRLLDEARGLSGLESWSLRELATHTGYPVQTAAMLKAAIELGRRAVTAPRLMGQQFRCGDDFHLRYGPLLKGKTREVFLTVLLDTKNRLIREEWVSEGTLNQSLVHPREVFQAAIREGANAVVLIHNHPSGDPTPSSEDILITKQLVKVGRLVGITVLDHVIIGDGDFYSFEHSKML